MARLVFLLLMLFAAPLAAQDAPSASRPASVSGVEVVQAGKQVLVAVPLTRQLRGTPRAFALAQPLRWAVDLPDAASGRFAAEGAGNVAAARISQFDAKSARLVIDLKAPMAIVAVTQDANNRLVLLLAPVAESAFRAQVARGRNPIGGFSFAPPPRRGEQLAEAPRRVPAKATVPGGTTPKTEAPKPASAKPATTARPEQPARLESIEAVLAAEAQRKVQEAQRVAQAAPPKPAVPERPAPSRAAAKPADQGAVLPPPVTTGKAERARVPMRPLTGPDAIAPVLGARVGSLPTVPAASASPTPAVASPEILPAAPPTPGVRPRVRSGKPLVVIDAGHGGKDPGAPAVTGGHEAQVTLAIAVAAKRAIERDGRMRVRLTREKDVFLTLNQRVSLARRWGADLFVSVHADSAPNPAARGASVYTLSEVASDAQAARLAAKENNADAIAGVSLRGQEREVTGLLIDLAQRDSMNASADFAQLLQVSLQPRGLPFRSTFHRFAGFRVLKNVGVPAVLLETGYMSNEEDSRFLTGREGQRIVGEGIADAAARFLLGETRVADRGSTGRAR